MRDNYCAKCIILKYFILKLPKRWILLPLRVFFFPKIQQLVHFNLKKFFVSNLVVFISSRRVFTILKIVEDERVETDEEEYAISSKPKQLGDDVIKSKFSVSILLYQARDIIH